MGLQARAVHALRTCLRPFGLARDIRELDMRASPYDLADFGYVAVKIETPEGRSEYEKLQREFAERARPIRRRLIELCHDILKEHSLTSHP